jgi:predicted amidohydrolase YtcJ
VKRDGEAPDLALVNGRAHTPGGPPGAAQALAIRAGRITAVGTGRDIRSLCGRATEVVNLEGRTVLPGMTDSHIHFYEWALNRRNLDLAVCASLDALLAQVRDTAERTPPEGWIIGVGWNEADWPEPRMPRRGDLDAAAPRHPVALWRCDMHLAAVNSAALQKAGIGPGTPDPPGGTVDRDSHGRPSGILRELAIHRIRDAIPPPSEADILEALKAGIRHAHSLGITGVDDIRLMNDEDGARALRAWQRLRVQNALDLRCRVALPGNRLEEAIALGLRTGFGDERLRIGHVKFFADGGMGARTAWMIDPYLDADHGMPQTGPEELLAQAARAEAAGLAVMVHAVGDRANREVIAVFERLQRRRRQLPNGSALPALPHRIEHVQMIHPGDLQRLAALDVALCLTPQNLVLDIGVVDRSVGSRGRWAYAFRDLVDTRRPVMFSSDAPVCDPSPFLGIQAAVTRCRRDGTPAGGWYPQSRVTVAEALAAYTATPAMVNGLGEELGTITPGRRADLVVCDRDIFSCDPLTISDTRIDMTVFDGRIVYTRPA